MQLNCNANYLLHKTGSWRCHGHWLHIFDFIREQHVTTMTDARTLRIGSIIRSYGISKWMFVNCWILTGRQQYVRIISFPRYAGCDIGVLIEGYVGNVRTSYIPNINAKNKKKIISKFFEWTYSNRILEDKNKIHHLKNWSESLRSNLLLEYYKFNLRTIDNKGTTRNMIHLIWSPLYSTNHSYCMNRVL